MKIVYLFDEISGKYLGEYIPQESPLEPGEYITPICSTDKKPPKEKLGSVIVIDNLSWRYATDNSGIWFDENGKEQNVENFDEVVNVNWTREKKEPTPQEQFIAASEAVRLGLQAAIDAKAKTLGFSRGDSLIQYAGFPNKYQNLALTFANWEVSIWDEADDYKALVIAGEKPMLTPAEAVAMMHPYPG